MRLRSVPVKLDAKLPRRAAILTGNVASDRGTAHAYVVFADVGSAAAALAHNMAEVSRSVPRHIGFRVRLGMQLPSASAPAFGELERNNYADLPEAVAGVQLDGLHLRVDLAAKPRRGGSSAGGGAGDGAPAAAGSQGAVLYEPARSVFVGNLPFDVQARFPSRFG